MAIRPYDLQPGSRDSLRGRPLLAGRRNYPRYATGPGSRQGRAPQASATIGHRDTAAAKACYPAKSLAGTNTRSGCKAHTILTMQDVFPGSLESETARVSTTTNPPQHCRPGASRSTPLTPIGTPRPRYFAHTCYLLAHRQHLCGVKIRHEFEMCFPLFRRLRMCPGLAESVCLTFGHGAPRSSRVCVEAISDKPGGMWLWRVILESSYRGDRVDRCVLAGSVGFEVADGRGRSGGSSV
jgi:hypothetical protein